ncbi:MAG: hypothetical protein ACPIOQ_02275 [Promethearchaeia archaeon]
MAAAGRTAAMALAAPARSYWATARDAVHGSCRGGASALGRRPRIAVPLAGSGQRRFLAEEKKEKKKDEGKAGKTGPALVSLSVPAHCRVVLA